MDQLARHEVTLLLFLSLMLQVAADHIKRVVLECKTVAQTSFVAHSGDEDVFAFGDLVIDNSADVL